MKFDDINSIEKILTGSVEETNQRDRNDAELWVYQHYFASNPYAANKSGGLDEALEYMQLCIDTNTPLDRSYFDEPSANDSRSEPDPFCDDNSDNIPF